MWEASVRQVMKEYFTPNGFVLKSVSRIPYIHIYKKEANVFINVTWRTVYYHEYTEQWNNVEIKNFSNVNDIVKLFMLCEFHFVMSNWLSATEF